MVQALLLTLAVGTSTSSGVHLRSGLAPGDEVSAWTPIHVAGPHAGTRTCPVCTYLDAPVLLAFARDTGEADKLAAELERIAAAHAAGRLKVMLVAVNGSDAQLQAVAKNRRVRHLMLCRPEAERKAAQLGLYKIDPNATNTVLLYEDYAVRRVWAELTPAEFAELAKATDAYRPK